MDDYKSLLHLSLKHLTLKDFTNAHKVALLALKTHPTRPEFPQIFTIAAVLLAAGNRLPDNQIDYFSVLQLDSTSSNLDIHSIRTKFKNLTLLLHPSKNKFPFASEGFQIVCDAWSFLSDPTKRTRLGNVVNTDGCAVKETFWTVCPYCYYLFEYEALYKDCCFRCQNCQRAFHGVAVPPPKKSMMVEGKEEFYCRFGWFPLKYYDSCLDEKKEKSGDCDLSGENDNVKNEELKSVGMEGKVESNWKVDETEKLMQGNGGSDKVGSSRKRVKSTAWNTKKITGRGKRVRMNRNKEFADLSGKNEEEKESEDLEFSVDDLEIVMGEDDIYIGLKKQD